MADTQDLNGQVVLRPGFDHATSPELLGGSFVGWGRLRAEGRAFRSDIRGSYVGAVAGLTALPLRWQRQDAVTAAT